MLRPLSLVLLGVALGVCGFWVWSQTMHEPRDSELRILRDVYEHKGVRYERSPAGAKRMVKDAHGFSPQLNDLWKVHAATSHNGQMIQPIVLLDATTGTTSAQEVAFFSLSFGSLPSNVPPQCSGLSLRVYFCLPDFNSPPIKEDPWRRLNATGVWGVDFLTGEQIETSVRATVKLDNIGNGWVCSWFEGGTRRDSTDIGLAIDRVVSLAQDATSATGITGYVCLVAGIDPSSEVPLVDLLRVSFMAYAKGIRCIELNYASPELTMPAPTPAL